MWSTPRPSMGLTPPSQQSSVDTKVSGQTPRVQPPGSNAPLIVLFMPVDGEISPTYVTLRFPSLPL